MQFALHHDDDKKVDDDDNDVHNHGQDQDDDVDVAGGWAERFVKAMVTVVTLLLVMLAVRVLLTKMKRLRVMMRTWGRGCS